MARGAELSYKSKAEVLAAFCCPLDSRAKLEVNVLAMRNYIGVPETLTLSDALPSEFVIIQADPLTSC